MVGLLALVACCGVPLVAVTYLRWLAHHRRRGMGRAVETPAWWREIDRMG